MDWCSSKTEICEVLLIARPTPARRLLERVAGRSGGVHGGLLRDDSCRRGRARWQWRCSDLVRPVGLFACLPCVAVGRDDRGDFDGESEPECNNMSTAL